MNSGNGIRPRTPIADSDEKLPLCCQAWIVEQTRHQEATAPTTPLGDGRIHAARASNPTARRPRADMRKG